MKQVRAFTRKIAVFLAATGIGCAAAAQSAHAERLAIIGAVLIDGTGRAPVPESVVYVADGKIERIGRVGDAIPAGTRRIEARGKFIIPGIVDAHTHVDSLGVAPMTNEQKKIAREYYPRAFLFNGVTSVVNMSAHVPAEVLALRDRANTDPKALVPRIYTGASHFTADQGWGGRHNGGIKSPDDINNRMDDYAARGFDLVKIIDEDGLGDETVFPKIAPEYLNAVMRAAAGKDLPVFIHATDADEYREAIAAGPRAIAHGLFTPLTADSDIVADLKQKNIFVVPTIVLFESFFVFLDNPALLNDPLLNQSVPDFIMAAARNPETIKTMRGRMDEILKMDAAAWARDSLPALLANTRILFEQGVKVAIGTDSGGAVMHAFQGYNTPREIEIMADCCMTPMQAIVAATRTGAEVIDGQAIFGTLEPGKSADLLLLNGDPLADIHNIRDFDWMMLRGHMIERSTLSYSSYVSERQDGTPALP
ncbi:amidohydrolase family protein [Sphingosinicella microcystinivorans]|uniref:amidohydrolase family protein n=1 Tax=Sphingosinicella microcystinivorans TaxID=335406 RepID=UPI0022F3C8F1|nr:amidohydrolase family protein [Sphingosinicella microcystinivorans]WBX84160.1 amidohydrolase family protein [Sphingosinicella microcystinivorans]